jgi:hypothetical protein
MKPFNQKIHLINHLKRKKNCPPTHADVSVESLLDELLYPHKTSPPQPDQPEQQQQQPTTPEPAAAAAAAAAAAPAVITNNGGINFFIFPGLNAAGAEPGETKILSSVNFNDIGTAIHSLLGFIVNKQQQQQQQQQQPQLQSEEEEEEKS